MLKRILPTISVFYFIFSLAAGTAYAKPQIDIYRGDADSRKETLNVMALPAIISADIPEEEHFFAETLEQTWNEIITKMRDGKRFKIRTKEQIPNFKDYLLESSADATENDAALAAAIAGLWTTDAVIRVTVTEAVRGVVSHEAQSRWVPEVRLGGGYWHGDWHPRGGVILQKDSTPAHDEFYAMVALKIEIRDIRDGKDTLLYGISARETAKSGMLPNQPSLTKLADSVLRAAAARLEKL